LAAGVAFPEKQEGLCEVFQGVLGILIGKNVSWLAGYVP
jgi:hypothetical protein